MSAGSAAMESAEGSRAAAALGGPLGEAADGWVSDHTPRFVEIHQAFAARMQQQQEQIERIKRKLAGRADALREQSAEIAALVEKVQVVADASGADEWAPHQREGLRSQEWTERDDEWAVEKLSGEDGLLGEYLVTRNSVPLRKEASLESDESGSLSKDAVIDVKELKVLSDGTIRLGCAAGWLSSKSPLPFKEWAKAVESERTVGWKSSVRMADMEHYVEHQCRAQENQREMVDGTAEHLVDFVEELPIFNLPKLSSSKTFGGAT
jgi:hypothetical protein